MEISKPEHIVNAAWFRGIATAIVTAMLIGIVSSLFAQTNNIREQLKQHQLRDGHTGLTSVVETELNHIKQDLDEIKTSQRRLEDLVIQSIEER